MQTVENKLVHEYIAGHQCQQSKHFAQPGGVRCGRASTCPSLDQLVHACGMKCRQQDCNGMSSIGILWGPSARLYAEGDKVSEGQGSLLPDPGTLG